MLPEEVQGSGETRIAGESGRVSPLQELRAGGVRNKQSVWGSPRRAGHRALRLADPLLHLPSCRSNNAGGREDGTGLWISQL